MSKIAGMQPYFFPYIGYFQLINAVDLFIVYDDGKMLSHEYIRRNSILSSTPLGSQYISLRISPGAYNKRINEVELSDNQWNIRKIIRTLRYSYSRAPYFEQTFPMIESCLVFPERNLVKYLVHELHTICEYIGITTPFVFSSEVPKDGLEYAEDKIFRLFDHFGIHDCINPCGGKQYYNKERWAIHGANITFLHRNDSLCYKQFKQSFVKDLSIIDVLMFNSPSQIRELLTQYTLE